MENPTDAAIEKAFASGAILRTHVMRPTWHFVAAEDIRWMLMLTSRRVNAINKHYYRKLELDDTIFKRSHKVLVRALRGGKHLTRVELRSVLDKAGIATDLPSRLGHILARAELDAIICNGPRKGKHFTYALLDERAKRTRSLTRDGALAELTRRYFTSHGPATLQDFAWWSGLTIADIRAGLAMVQHDILDETIDDKRYWFSSSVPDVKRPSRVVYLLPSYDEYLIAYKDRSASLDASQLEKSMATNPVFDSPIVIGGRVVGTWRRTLKDDSVVVSIRPFLSFGKAQKAAVMDAARRYGAFLGLKTSVETLKPV